MKQKCPNCGMVIEGDYQNCPKCDADLDQPFKDEVLKIDIAHHGENWAVAKVKLEQAIDRSILENYKGLKVIHGKGVARGHTSVIRNHAIPYLEKYAQQNNFKLVQDRKTDGAHILYFGP